MVIVLENVWGVIGLSNFEKLCKVYNINYEITPNYIKYRTSSGGWMIEYNLRGKTVTLWHLNNFNNGNGKFNDYHVQHTYDVDENILKKILQYTYYHDKQLIKNVGKPDEHMQKMNQLFSQIHKKDDTKPDKKSKKKFNKKDKEES